MSSELTQQERDQGFTRPVRTRVQHDLCQFVSILRTTDALDMARDPSSWSSCYCLQCGRRLPASQFTWFPGGERVGT